MRKSRSGASPDTRATGEVMGGVMGAPHRLEFDNNQLLPELYGAHGHHLARIEQMLDVSITNRGNQVFVEGAADACARALSVLTTLYRRLESGAHIARGDVDGVLRLVSAQTQSAIGAHSKTDTDINALAGVQNLHSLRTHRREVLPRSQGQAAYIDALTSCELVLGIGPAGTGKTYLAVAAAAAALMAGQIERIILSRPAIEAGERLGFLPGDLREKIDPYLRPLYDALYDMLPRTRVERALASGDIEIAPLAFMRGRTLRNAFIILDEAQNANYMQMKMFLTRLGEGSRMVITGDPSQIDLPRGVKSGLHDALDVLAGIAAVKIIRFGARDVVRHDLVAKIIEAYEHRDRQYLATANHADKDNRQ